MENISQWVGIDVSQASAITDLVGWVEVTKPNIAFISYLNLLGFTLFNPTYILFHTRG
jgi:hypothetical protein